MIRLRAAWVRPTEEARLRQWLAEVSGPRAQEAVTTLVEEGCTHELAIVVRTADGPLLISAMEVGDEDRVDEVFNTSEHPIDKEHKEMLQTSLDSPADADLVLDLRR
jgi:hypothetical protein